jgi:hypothetical protein
MSTSACTIPEGALPSRCQAIEVDEDRELMVTDETTLADPRFSFSRIMGAVLEGTGNASPRVWTDAWAGADGESSLREEVVGPWEDATNGTLDLREAPFELVAIANRIDLGTLAPSRSAEIRFVYGLVSSGARRPLTVAVELRLPDTETTAEWATGWHGLGVLSGGAHVEALASIVDGVMGAPLAGQVRTQDARVSPSILLEFDLGHPTLAPSPLFNQPAPSVEASALSAFVSTNASLVMADKEVLPASMLAPEAHAMRPSMSLPGVTPDLSETFIDQTCAGCHTAEPTVDGTFHISPLERGSAALSPFLTTASADEPSELSRRAEVLRGLVCM